MIFEKYQPAAKHQLIEYEADVLRVEVILNNLLSLKNLKMQ